MGTSEGLWEGGFVDGPRALPLLVNRFSPLSLSYRPFFDLELETLS